MTDLPEPGYDAVCGVPLAVLDDLEGLRERAFAGDITLQQWRGEFRAIRNRVALDRTVVDAARVAAAEALDEAFDQQLAAEEAPDGTASEKTAAQWRERRVHVQQVIMHLGLLVGPPTDEQVMVDLPASDRQARVNIEDLSADSRTQILVHLERRERLHAAWRADLGLPAAPL